MNQKGYLNKVSKKRILTIALTILSILVIYGLYVFYPIYKKIQFYNEYGWLIGEWNYEHYNMEDKSISSYTMDIVYNKVYFGDIPRNFHIENNSLIIEVGESGRDLILPIDIEEKRIYVDKNHTDYYTKDYKYYWLLGEWCCDYYIPYWGRGSSHITIIDKHQLYYEDYPMPTDYCIIDGVLRIDDPEADGVAISLPIDEIKKRLFFGESYGRKFYYYQQ